MLTQERVESFSFILMWQPQRCHEEECHGSMSYRQDCKVTVVFWRKFRKNSPEGPGIENIWSRPSGLKILSDRSWIEIFDRAHLCNTRRAPWIKFSIEIENFKPGLKLSIGIAFFDRRALWVWKKPETLSEFFLELPHREYGWEPPSPRIQCIWSLPSIFRGLSLLVRLGTPFSESGPGAGLPEPVMEFPAVLTVLLKLYVQKSEYLHRETKTSISNRFLANFSRFLDQF